MIPRRKGLSDPTHLSPDAEIRPQATEAEGEGRFSKTLLISLGALCIFIAVLGVWFVIYQTFIKPRREFNPQIAQFVFERDALEDEIPVVPVLDIFSEEKISRYQNGSGFTAVFRILNDPRKKYGVNEESWTLPPSAGYEQTGNQARWQFIQDKGREFEAVVARFREPIPLVRSLEIGLDDTEGVNDQVRTWISHSLTGLEQELTSPKDTIKFFVFRLTDADYLNYQEFTIPAGTKVEAAKKSLEQGLAWLLEARGQTRESAVATGLFNAMELSRDVRRRLILVFSDVMENSPATVSFYPVERNLAFLDQANWGILDAAISRYEPFPDLRYARVKWYFPPVKGTHFRAVARYWEHVLQKRCQAKEVETIY